MAKRLLLLAMVVAGPVMPGSLEAQDSCMTAAVTNVDMQDCASRRARAVDSLRIVVESAVANSLEDFERIQEFRRDRELWFEFRETHCRFVSRDTGSMALLLFLGCHADLTAERIDGISDLVCEGAGLTGTCPEAEDYRAALRRFTPN